MDIKKVARITGRQVICKQNTAASILKTRCPVKQRLVYVSPKGWLIRQESTGELWASSDADFYACYRDPYIKGHNWDIDEQSRVLIPTGMLTKQQILEIANEFRKQ